MHASSHRDESPLAMVERLAAEGASGELIAASECLEVHVYLLAGRVAWATSSTAPNAFSRHLVGQCGLSGDALREVFAECQRTKKRLGETLVEWGLASLEQVREALHAQITGALATLVGSGAARALFLPRRMEYSPELTFDLQDLEAATPSATPSELVASADVQVRTLMRALPDALWVQLVRQGRIASSGAQPGVPPPPRNVVDLAALLAAGGADGFTVRSAFGTIVGQALAEPACSLWCALGSDAKLGVASALLAAMGIGSAVDAQAPRRTRVEWTASAGTGPLTTLAPLESAITGADELLAAAVIARGGSPEAWVKRQRLELEPVRSVAAAYAPLLDLSFVLALTPAAPSTRLVAYEQLSLRVATGSYSHFATLVGGGRMCLWLTLDYGTPQGLGWALLATLARQLGDCVVA